MSWNPKFHPQNICFKGQAWWHKLTISGSKGRQTLENTDCSLIWLWVPEQWETLPKNMLASLWCMALVISFQPPCIHKCMQTTPHTCILEHSWTYTYQRNIPKVIQFSHILNRSKTWISNYMTKYMENISTFSVQVTQVHRAYHLSLWGRLMQELWGSEVNLPV